MKFNNYHQADDNDGEDGEEEDNGVEALVPVPTMV